MARVVVVAGSTGLVGSKLVEVLIAHADIARVVCVVRKATGRAHPKLEERVVDMASLSADAIPKDVDDAYCALGTTIKVAGSTAAFAAVDKDAVVQFARACRAAGARQFMVVSSLGADARARNFYLRTKGEMEAAVSALGFEVVHIARPSILTGGRTQDRPAERIGIVLASAVTKLVGTSWAFAPIHGGTVARALVRCATHRPGATDQAGHRPLQGNNATRDGDGPAGRSHSSAAAQIHDSRALHALAALG